MPNWCFNELVVDGQKKDIESFLEKIESNQQGLLSAFVECPAEYTVDTQENGYPSWYIWRIENWGTKWDVPLKEVSIDTDYESFVHMSFDTAWSPPEAWLNSVRKLYPDLKISLSYSEPNMELKGVL